MTPQQWTTTATATAVTAAATTAAAWWTLRRVRDDLANIRSIVIAENATLRELRDTLKETP